MSTRTLARTQRDAHTVPEAGERETVSVPEGARILGISRTLAYELIARGEFPVRVIRLGTRRVIPRRELLAFING